MAGTSECVLAAFTAKNVLQQSVTRTIRDIEKGILLYYERAQAFDSFPAPMDDDFTLQSMYGRSLQNYRDINHFFDIHHERNNWSKQVQNVVDYCKELGSGLKVQISKIGQECEKEVEAEEEQEREDEIEVESRHPFPQNDWDYQAVFSNSNRLFNSTFTKLKDAIQKNVKELSRIQWSGEVYCSPNFFKTTSCYAISKSVSSYLRPVSHVIIFQDGRVVLISAYEMDKLLPLWWRHRQESTLVAVIDNLFLLNKGGHRLAGPTGLISTQAMTTLKLFRGYVDFCTDEEKVLADMVQNLD